MLETLLNQGGTAGLILELAIILFAGFLMTRLTKLLKFPNVTGYILAGILLGPYVLKIIPASSVSQMDFVTDIALAFIAFGVGKYFKLSTLKKSGPRVLVVTIFEALGAALFITLSMIFIFHLSVPFSILLGAIGCATAPASTIMTIRQYKAKGEFVNTILQVVALDDAVALIAFSICAAVAQAMSAGGSVDAGVILFPVLMNLVALVLAVGFGFVLHKLVNVGRSKDHRLVLAVAFILLLTGFCALFDISPLLSCMMLGAAYINFSGNKQLFKQVNGFTPPILLLFFVISGMKLNVPALATAGLIGVAYFFIRILGKYAGASLAGLLCKAPPAITRYLGLALIPQAGVSIGLAALGQRLLPAEMGTLLTTIILSSAVLYEMIGPACAKASLFLAHAIPDRQKEPEPEGGIQEPEGGQPVPEPPETPPELVESHAQK